MAQESISLQDLIYQVKHELLTPNRRAEAQDPYPLFAIEKIELEIAVAVKREGQVGLRISVLEFGSSVSREQGHTVKVTLGPLLTPEEMRKQVVETHGAERIQRETQRGLIKGPESL